MLNYKMYMAGFYIVRLLHTASCNYVNGYETFLHMRTHTYLHAHTHTHKYMHTHMRTHALTYTHAHNHTQKHLLYSRLYMALWFIFCSVQKTIRVVKNLPRPRRYVAINLYQVIATCLYLIRG